ncbi:MAG: hypothetical protein NW208_06160 [Bryobacter sp.]|nr:hypothetical protein [Bryobacter sp.]
MATRTTITLEDDLRDQIRLEAAQRRASFRDTLNDLLRLGLQQARRSTTKGSVHMIPTRKMNLRPGLSYDSTSKLLEAIEEPRRS